MFEFDQNKRLERPWTPGARGRSLRPIPRAESVEDASDFIESTRLSPWAVGSGRDPVRPVPNVEPLDEEFVEEAWNEDDSGTCEGCSGAGQPDEDQDWKDSDIDHEDSEDLFEEVVNEYNTIESDVRSSNIAYPIQQLIVHPNAPRMQFASRGGVAGLRDRGS